jgi:hypothetical protein
MCRRGLRRSDYELQTEGLVGVKLDDLSNRRRQCVRFERGWWLPQMR